MKQKRQFWFGLIPFIVALVANAAPVQVTVPAVSPPPEVAGLGLHILPHEAPNPDLFVFTSFSSKLVANDTNGFSDVFLWSRTNREIRLLSVGMNGQPANGPSYDPAITKDGRYVVFVSAASNLVPNDTNHVEDVFVKDLQTGALDWITPTVQTNGLVLGSTRDPIISEDGRYVAFATSRFAYTNIPNIHVIDRAFVYERATRTFLWASEEGDKFVGAEPLALFGSSFWFKTSTSLYGFDLTTGEVSVEIPTSVRPAFSSDGSMVAVQTLTTGTNVVSRYHVAERQLETLVVSTNSSMAQTGLSMSDDGRIAFLTDAQLLPNDTNAIADLYVTEPVGRSNSLLLASSPVPEGATRFISNPTISANGEQIYFRMFTIYSNDARSGGLIVRNLADLAPAVAAPPWSRAMRSQLINTPGGIYLLADANEFGFQNPTAENDLIFLDSAFNELDSDGDGLPDWWEMAKFGSLGQNGSADPDGDGMSNLAEYLAGTDPNSALSVLKLEIVNDGGLRRLIYANTTKSVSVQYRNAADLGAWMDLQWPSIEGDGRPSFLDSDSISRRFYQIRLQP